MERERQGQARGRRVIATTGAAAAGLLQVAAAAPPPAATAAERHAFEAFAHVLLIEKNPRAAYAGAAADTFVQKSPPFAPSRETTIAQWEKLTANPASRFMIESIEFQGDVAVLRFHGQLDPTQPGADVVLHDRLADGKIVEEWSEYQVARP